MSTVPPPPDDADLTHTTDLSDLAATDALFDRLAARQPSEQDLLDPAALALNRLLGEIDAESGADSATARLVEVLSGRPLYIDGPAVVQSEAGEDLIDLTAVPDEPSADDIATVPPVEVVPIDAARPRRRRTAVSGVPGPVAAASIAVMVLLGGGVSAAVAGDPMAPLNGVGSVVAKLTEVSQADNTEDKLKEAQAELVLAQQLVASDPVQAAVHLDAARKMLEQLPDDDTAALDQQLDVLAGLLPATPTDPSAVPGATTAPTALPPVATPTGADPATSTPDAPVATTPTTPSVGGDTDPSTPPTSAPDDPDVPTSPAPTTGPTVPTTEPTSGSGGGTGHTEPPPTSSTSSTGAEAPPVAAATEN